jgi:thiol-disulfide isomerase/thioredoxin
MLKTTIIIAVSISATMFSGYVNGTKPTGKKELLAISSKPTTFADTTLLKVGDKCPDIVFRDTTGYNGLDVKLSNFKGKYVLIDVWASWCSPCRAQYPHLVLLEEKMKSKAITFVSISVDSQVWRWKGPMLTKMGGIQWLIKDKVFEKAFGINTIPRYILLDKRGNILSLNMPSPLHPELEEQLNKLKGI